MSFRDVYVVVVAEFLCDEGYGWPVIERAIGGDRGSEMLDEASSFECEGDGIDLDFEWLFVADAARWELACEAAEREGVSPPVCVNAHLRGGRGAH